MDTKVFENISYGMYIITTRNYNKNIGCFINTLSQVTSKEQIVSVTLNKDNYTTKNLKESKICAISILEEKASKELISRFGYFSSKNTDKFKDTKWEEIDKLPVVTENTCGYIIGEIINMIDVNTHNIFLIKVKTSKMLSNNSPMTYKYYHEVLKGKASPKAPTYNNYGKDDNMKKGKKYKCSICGYIYDDAKEKIKFEDLPNDWKCPICGVGKDKFIEI